MGKSENSKKKSEKSILWKNKKNPFFFPNQENYIFFSQIAKFQKTIYLFKTKIKGYEKQKNQKIPIFWFKGLSLK